MPSFNSLWNVLEKEKPRLKNPTSIVVMDPDQLKRLCWSFYEQGMKMEKATQEFNNEGNDLLNSLSNPKP